ncbi:MAG TPA: peptidyl-prolyl cis-trans isomerase [Chthoniobacter sp.]|nr:peptidyl-prolyl cis-trans isomerase [Chthoniobacter sp.]
MVYHLFRKYQQGIMIAVTLVTIVTFAGFYSHSDFLDRGSANRAGTIYGRSVSLPQAQKAIHKGDVCLQLAQMEMMYGGGGEHTMGDLYQSLAINRMEAKENFLWNSIVLKQEAQNLGITVSEEEIFTATTTLPVFQTNGAYDSGRFDNFSRGVLGPLGLTTDDFGDLIGDALRLKKIKALLGSTVAPSESDIRDAFTRLNQKTEASVVRFKFDDFLAGAQVPDEDLKKRFEERKTTLNTEETRKVKYVAFTLPATEKLEGAARGKALSELQKQAEDFAVAMTNKDAKFDEVAANAKAPVKETPDFTIAKPPEALDASEEIAGSAFKLNLQQPNSDVLETARGYYILQLTAVTPPRPLTFDEAKGALVETMKRERAQEALNLKATEVRNKIETEIKGGKTFAAAAEAVGVKAEEFPAFSPKEPKVEPANSGEIMQTASELNEGQLSTAVPTSDGSVIVYVTKRLPIDEAKLKTDRAQLADALGNAQRTMLFQQWLRLRRAAAQLQTSFHA